MLTRFPAFVAIPLLVLLPAFAGCTPAGGADDDDEGHVHTGAVAFENFGDNSLEGHTPRGFSGQGTGLFVGDNINGGFPEGDGVQVYLTVDLSDGAPDGEIPGDMTDGDYTVTSAVLRAAEVRVNGSPFETLGDLLVEHVEFDAFSRELFDLEASSSSGCVFATSADDDFSCDVTELVQASLDGGRQFVQFRLLTEIAGDSDGQADMIVFNPNDSNTVVPGLFELDVTAEFEEAHE